jgi:hypothetical protein
MIPVFVLCAVWHIAAPLTLAVIVYDVLRPSLNITDCANSTLGTWLMALVVAYIGCLLAYTLQLSYSIRNVYVEFNETRQLATALYIFTFTAGLVLILQVSDAIESIKLGFAIRSIGIIVAFISFVLIVFIPKLLVYLCLFA